MTTFPDWLTLTAPLTTDDTRTGGQWIKIAPDGTTERATDRRIYLAGSYDETIGVRTRPDHRIELHGNPIKFLSGHNCYSAHTLATLIPAILAAVTERLGLLPTPDDRDDWEAGNVHLTRADLTRMLDLSTPARVRAFLAAAGPVARHPRLGRAIAYGDETLYIGRSSQRVTIKLYDKRRELEAHPLSRHLPAPDRERLLAWSEGKLRAEITVRAKELQKRDLQRAAHWTDDTAADLLSEYLGELELPDVLTLPDDAIRALPRGPRLAYHAWRNGDDLTSIYNRSTLYRHRDALRPLGIDILHTRPRAAVTAPHRLTETPLRDLLRGPGVPPPAWATDCAA